MNTTSSRQNSMTPGSPQKQTPASSLPSGSYFKRIVSGFISLLRGMGLTVTYLTDPRTVVTQQYPENRATLLMTPRFRACLTMVRDETGAHCCTACGLCEKACPNGTISVLTMKDLSGRKMLGKYVYRLLQCTFCNLCVETCPFGAIVMGQNYELAAYDRDALVLTLHSEEDEPHA